MAMCKPDLVAAVLQELGYEVPDGEALTKIVFQASARLKEEHGLKVEDCLVLSPVNADWYRGSIREGALAKERSITV